MALLLDSGTFEAKSIAEGKTSVSILAWENTEGRDVRIEIYALLGVTGGLLDANAATFTPSVTVTTSGAVFSKYPGWAQTKRLTTSTTEAIRSGPVYVPTGATVTFIPSSSNAADTDIDGSWDIIDTQAGVDVRAVGGATPISKTMVEKDARMRINKATQTKATGTIIVRNDDDDSDLYRVSLSDLGDTIQRSVSDLA